MVFVNKISPLLNQIRKPVGLLLTQWQLAILQACVKFDSFLLFQEIIVERGNVMVNTSSTKSLLPVWNISELINVGDIESGRIQLI